MLYRSAGKKSVSVGALQNLVLSDDQIWFFHHRNRPERSLKHLTRAGARVERVGGGRQILPRNITNILIWGCERYHSSGSFLSRCYLCQLNRIKGISWFTIYWTSSCCLHTSHPWDFAVHLPCLGLVECFLFSPFFHRGKLFCARLCALAASHHGGFACVEGGSAPCICVSVKRAVCVSVCACVFTCLCMSACACGPI